MLSRVNSSTVKRPQAARSDSGTWRKPSPQHVDRFLVRCFQECSQRNGVKDDAQQRKPHDDVPEAGDAWGSAMDGWAAVTAPSRRSLSKSLSYSAFSNCVFSCRPIAHFALENSHTSHMIPAGFRCDPRPAYGFTSSGSSCPASVSRASSSMSTLK